jgi:ketosteroid isomerase-like protein
MTTDAERIADQLRAESSAPQQGGPSVMASLYADTVELRHTPPRRADGPIEASALRAISVADMAAVSRGLKEREFDTPRITVEGSSIRIQSTMRGTMASGDPIKVDNDVLLEVRDGKIVTLEAHRDEESWAQWFKVLEAGGFDPPAEWLARGGHTPADHE